MNHQQCSGIIFETLIVQNKEKSSTSTPNTPASDLECTPFTLKLETNDTDFRVSWSALQKTIN